MYIFIHEKNSSEPAVTNDIKKLFYYLKNYDLKQVNSDYFIAEKRKEKITGYKNLKGLIIDFAQEWQYNFSGFNYSYSNLIFYDNFFNEYGKRFGLITEFKENCII